MLNTAASSVAIINNQNLDEMNLDTNNKSYDYTLRFLLIGDGDVGKNEVFEFLDRSNQVNSSISSFDQNSPAASPISPTKSSGWFTISEKYFLSTLFSFILSKENDYFRSSIINCNDLKIRLLIWSASGQGRFNTILRSYSRGAQGIILVYDITNKWSFNSIERWYDELETVCFFVILLLFYVISSCFFLI